MIFCPVIFPSRLLLWVRVLFIILILKRIAGFCIILFWWISNLLWNLYLLLLLFSNNIYFLFLFIIQLYYLLYFFIFILIFLLKLIVCFFLLSVRFLICKFTLFFALFLFPILRYGSLSTFFRLWSWSA